MKTVIIAGSGRSGTTWIQDSLAEANDMSTLFEPLHPAGVPKAGRFAYQYLEAGERDNALEAFMDVVFSGKMRSLWAVYRIRSDRFNFFRKGIKQSLYNTTKLARHVRKYHRRNTVGIVVKFIRANLMLPWLAERYRLPILLVVRHPCAVVASRLALGGTDWSADRALTRYRDDRRVVDLIRERFGMNINLSMSSAAALACVWCIENMLPLEWAQDSGYSVTAYETLVEQPDEWQRITQELDLEHTPGRNLLSEPSQQASTSLRGDIQKGHKIGKWKQRLEGRELEDIDSILRKFSCTCYDIDNQSPRGVPLS